MSRAAPPSLRAIQADIVTLDVDAIVNAANASLLGGGVYGYPVELAAKVAVTTVREVLAAGAGPRHVLFCCFSRRDLGIYEALLAQ